MKADIHSSISFLQLAAKHTCWNGVRTYGGQGRERGRERARGRERERERERGRGRERGRERERERERGRGRGRGKGGEMCVRVVDGEQVWQDSDG